MKKTFSSKKSAFSLIELSIVLIIIGLLIAGVTGGASLIRSSELRSAMGEARGYAVAVNGFYSQYNALPGDYYSGVPGSGTYAGVSGSIYAGTTNGFDNKIEYYATDTSANSSESVVAWDQLIKTGSIDSTLTLTQAASTAAQVYGTHMPASKIKFAGWHFDYRNNVGGTHNYALTTVAAGATAEGAANAPSNQNVVVLTGTTIAASSTKTLVNGATNSSLGAVTGPDALSIDTKIDDGFANAGKVRGLNPSNFTTGCYTASTNANAAYILTSATSKVCALTFQVDTNS
jgi:prepilin-type N-terminal cleavage/methylation domain-containing protein